MVKPKKEEKALYFPNAYTGPIKPINLEKTSRSVKLHVKKIEEAKAESVLDLGCGSGGILLALQNAGIKEIHGIDASPEAIEMVKKRFEKFGTLENTSFTVGDITQFDPPAVD
ncbi:MAG: class I SAM-dependent methyltransferase, partial [Candidatus Heimdallarchaeota archaeon]